jgi:CheY-like chemotaxis protein
VEDSYFIMTEYEALCAHLGWEIVGPATRLGQALALARSEVFDAALLDVNLHGEMSWEIADILKVRHIPFAFCTGYDQSTILPQHLVGTPVLEKPFRIADIERVLGIMMAGGS